MCCGCWVLLCSGHIFVECGCCVLGLAQCWGWVSEVVWFVMAVGCLGQSVCSFFVDARQWADEFSLVCCGCLVLFENCIVDASIFFFVIFV